VQDLLGFLGLLHAVVADDTARRVVAAALDGPDGVALTAAYERPRHLHVVREAR
jgi:hypothetical protein